MKLTQHYLSAAYPAMQDHEYQALLDSINVIGVQQPITLFEGQIIDGWNRYKAANELGMDCPTIELGDVDPIDFAKSQSARRNITPSQNALAITAIYAWAPVGKPAKPNVAVTSTLAKTNAELAAIAGVSKKTIQQAKAVQASGVQAVQDAVKTGAVSVETAAAVSKLPAKEQKKIAAKGPDAMRAAAKPTVVRPAHIEPEDRDYSGPTEAELKAAQDTAKVDLDKVMELLESDDPAAALLKENERLRMELATVKSQRDGYMNQANELIRRVKSLKKMLDKAQGK